MNKQIRLFGNVDNPFLLKSIQIDIVVILPYIQEYNVFTIFFNDSAMFKLLSPGIEYVGVNMTNLEIFLEKILSEYNFELVSNHKKPNNISEDVPNHGNKEEEEESIKEFNYNNFPYSQPSEIQESLERVAEGSNLARNVLLENNLRLVGYIAKKFEHTDEDFDDLVSIGTVGLIKALENFNPIKGVKFSTFASRCIENEILMYLRSRKKQSTQPSYDLDLIEERSPNTYIDESGHSSEDTVDIFYKKELYKYIDILDTHEKEIIIKRFGLEPSGIKRTYQDIATELKISLTDVSQTEKRALVKLQKAVYSKKK